MIQEHDEVVLLADHEAEQLTAGDVGVVVHVYGDQAAFEVEFLTLQGDTVAVVTLEAGLVRGLEATDMPHARRLSPSEAA